MRVIKRVGLSLCGCCFKGEGLTKRSIEREGGVRQRNSGVSRPQLLIDRLNFFPLTGPFLLYCTSRRFSPFESPSPETLSFIQLRRLNVLQDGTDSAHTFSGTSAGKSPEIDTHYFPGLTNLDKSAYCLSASLWHRCCQQRSTLWAVYSHGPSHCPVGE